MACSGPLGRELTAAAMRLPCNLGFAPVRIGFRLYHHSFRSLLAHDNERFFPTVLV